MRILLTNDDGIDAPGLVALFDAVTEIVDGAIVLVVAPDRGRSECGHSVTTGRDLIVTEIRSGWLAVDGTPVDCVRAATSTLFPNVDAVISGINAGANLGTDLLVSGTFAAAREAAVQGFAAMAVSHYRRPDVPRSWDHSTEWLRSTIIDFAEAARLTVSESPNAATDRPFWNVNLPAVDPNGPIPIREECEVEPHPLLRTGTVTAEGRGSAQQLSMTSDFHSRPRTKGSDVDRCFSGRITLSRLAVRIV